MAENSGALKNSGGEYVSQLRIEDASRANLAHLDRPLGLTSRMGRTGLHIISSDTNLVEHPLECVNPQTRELRPDELEILDDFRRTSKTMVEWFLRFPLIEVAPANLYDFVAESGRAVTPSSISQNLQRIQLHPVMGRHVFDKGNAATRRYWCDYNAGLFTVSDSQAMEAIGKRDTPSHAVTPARAIEPFEALPAKWQGRFPAPQFESALHNHEVHTTVLSERGLMIHQYDNERHVFVGDKLIALPAGAVHIVHLLALHPSGIVLEVLQRKLEKVTQAAVNPELLQEYMSLIECQLSGTDCLESICVNEIWPGYKVRDAIERDSSEWPEQFQLVTPGAALE